MMDSAGENSSEADEAAKELEHEIWQNTMDKELNELNQRLEQKEVWIIIYINAFLAVGNGIVQRRKHLTI